MKIQNTVNSEFAHRLRVVMTEKSLKVSPTVLANLFNLTFYGRGITPHTARNWLLGNSFPTQDKLVHLAKLLDTSAGYLRFGRQSEKTFVINNEDGSEKELTIAQQQFVRRYLLLKDEHQQLLNKIASEFSRKS